MVIAGLGGMGSAAAAACAARGARVLGVEQYERGHALGASSGKSRIIRRAYFEDIRYVPLLERAYELWRGIEARSGESMLFLDGMLTVGHAESELVTGAIKAAQAYELDAELWDASEIRERYPVLHVLDGERAVFEPDGGFLVPEIAIEANCALAEAAGATLLFDTGLSGWSDDGEFLGVDLSNGERVRTSRLILTMGPWLQNVLKGLGVPIRIQRNVAAWFSPSKPMGPSTFISFLLDRANTGIYLYGFPDVGDGVKAAFHGHGEFTDPQHLNRAIDIERDVEPLARALEDWAPGAADAFLDAKPCMYALTPDEDFVIDLHPHDERVVVCGGFSGHGFKFASVVGEIASQLAFGGGTDLDIEFLSIGRFTNTGG